MSTRITKSDIEHSTNIANRMLEHMGHPHRLYIGFAYGQPRVFWVNPETELPDSEASPRGTKREIYDWLGAFIDGLAAADRAQRENAPQAPHIADLAGQVDAFLAEIPEGLSTYERMTRPEVSELEDRLTGKAWLAARLLDKLKGTDPNKRTGNSPAMGTPNRRSITYKVRKALGYSYP